MNVTAVLDFLWQNNCSTQLFNFLFIYLFLNQHRVKSLHIPIQVISSVVLEILKCSVCERCNDFLHTLTMFISCSTEKSKQRQGKLTYKVHKAQKLFLTPKCKGVFNSVKPNLICMDFSCVSLSLPHNRFTFFFKVMARSVHGSCHRALSLSVHVCAYVFVSDIEWSKMGRKISSQTHLLC